jgi:hypothetical protein
MPFVQDFNELFARGSFPLSVPKWRPLVIEYGYGYIQNVANWYWRIQGTAHAFRMPYAEIMQQTNGKYDEHIHEFLQGFREDYLGWAYGGFKEPWMREYHEEYKNFIEL